MRILIASTFVPYTDEAGPTLAGHLRRELAARGYQADTAALPFNAGRAAADQLLALRLLDLSESCGDTIDRLITLGAPAHVLRHPNKVAWFDGREEVPGGNGRGDAGPPALFRHRPCGEVTHAVLTCAECGEPLRAGDVDVEPGPAAEPTS